MDDNAKKKLANAKKLIQQQKYNQALQDLQIMVYKYAKLFQVHLMTGLCYNKMGKDKEAEKAFLEVLDLKPDQSNAMRELCDIYNKRGDSSKSAHYLQMSSQILKKSDPKKYRQAVVKLIEIYSKQDNLQKIDPIFKQYLQNQEVISEDFVKIAEAQFRIGTKNLCFNMETWLSIGAKDGKIRPIVPAARQAMNRLLVEVSDYLRAVSLQYQLTQQNIANNLVNMKLYFPEAASVLMLMLFDEYSVGQLSYSQLLLSEILRLLQAYFDRTDNGYLNLEYTEHETFSVIVLLSFEYLSFFKEFFTLDDLLIPYMSKLATLAEKLQSEAKIREQYRKKIRNFILKECRELNVQSRFGAVQYRLENLKERILKLEGSFLEQVIAKIALHCVFNYQKINDLKNMLKLRIKNLKQNECSPHLYKYYYEYLLRIARVFKALDEEIPLQDILNYITKYDSRDRKYYVEKVWFQFCMGCKDADKKPQLAQQCLGKLQEELLNSERDLKSTILRRIIVLKIYLGDYEVNTEIEAALENQRSFQNLQSTGFYYYYQGKIKQALLILKQAFRLNQLHYHTNRLLFLCLLKTSAEKQAIDFLERIKQGFPSVFWINYILATNKMNERKFLEAEHYLNISLQNFEAGVGGFRFNYERVKDLGPFSLQFLVKQNIYGIFYEEIIFPQSYIYEQSKIVSTSYFQERISENRVRLYRQQGELLKVLGRIKSALNYLYEGYAAASYIQVDENTSATDLLDICLVKKQYSTLLFYMRQFKQCEVILDQSQVLSSYLIRKSELPMAFMEKLDNQIKALAFEISVERLSIMMRFQSFELIDEYLTLFKSKIVPPTKPSLNFLKNKYQFYILQYMHSRKDSSELQASIAEFLQYFKLSLKERCTLTFQTILFDLKDQERRAVRECIEDYYIVLYLKKEPIKQEEILHMLQIFSRSNALLILFGMLTTDLSRKTAAFLKCIQMQKQSTISIDILASLYLKQKNYLAAAKLFLKSLQVDLLNVKCYLGLSICLFCLVCRAIQTKTQGQLAIIEKSLIRINSYMEYLKLQDPSENYHLLAFLKLLLNNQNLNDFQVKFILQSAQRSLYRHKDSLLGELLNEATFNWGNASIWKGDHHIKMVEEYLKSLPSFQTKDSRQLAQSLANNCKSKIQDLERSWNSLGKQVLIKNLSKNLNQIAVSVNLSIKQNSFKSKFYQTVLASIRICQSIFSSACLPDYQLQNLKIKLKKYLFQYIFIDGFNRERINQVQWQIFKQFRCYEYLAKYSDSIPKVQRQISFCLLKDPTNEYLRTIFNSWSVGVQGIHLRKPRQLPYKLQILNNINENSITSERSYRQLTLLYRDDTAFILYIQSCWNNHYRRQRQNVQTWIRQILYLQQKDSVKKNKELTEKTTRLKLQMLAFLLVKQGIKLAVHLNSYQQNKYDKLVWLNRLMCGEKIWSEMNHTFKGQFDDFDWWILLSALSWLTQTFALKSEIKQLLENISQLAQCPRKKGFIALLKIISILSYSAETEQQLVDQIIGITNVAQICNGKIAPNSEVIIQCFKYFLTSCYDAIDIQLSRAAEKCRIVNYSDKVLINFFEVLKYYKCAESNPNQQGVTESFYYIVNSMICLVQQPIFKGFFMSLKGIIKTLTTIQQGKDRNLKMSILLDPSASHSLLGLK